jgi:hypothetical protein
MPLILKKNSILSLLLACTVCSAGLCCGCVSQQKIPKSSTQPKLSVAETDSYRFVLHFLQQKMTSPDGGIYTNYLNKASENEITRGHDILSESQGLMMRYAADTGNQKLFQSSWGYVQKNLLLKNGLIAWRYADGQTASSNATVDDLRICQALRKAADRFGHKEYLQEADKIANALYQYCRRDSFLLSGVGQTQPVLPSYLDMEAIDANATAQKRWQFIANQTRQILKDAVVSPTLPLYQQTFRPANHCFDSQKQFDTVSSLLAFYYQSMDGTKNLRACAWLKQQCLSSGLVSAYDSNGKAVTQTQSTAIYALAMLCAREQNDAGLYATAKKKLCSFQVSNVSSPIYGAFGNSDTQEVFSFDNLLALLALEPTPENGKGAGT